MDEVQVIGFKILNDQKLDVDLVPNPEGLPYVDMIFRHQSSGRINGWHSLNKEQLEEVVRELQRKLAEL